MYARVKRIKTRLWLSRAFWNKAPLDQFMFWFFVPKLCISSAHRRNQDSHEHTLKLIYISKAWINVYVMVWYGMVCDYWLRNLNILNLCICWRLCISYLPGVYCVSSVCTLLSHLLAFSCQQAQSLDRALKKFLKKWNFVKAPTSTSSLFSSLNFHLYKHVSCLRQCLRCVKSRCRTGDFWKNPWLFG